MSLSAVVTCYESAGTIGLTIASLAAQSSPPGEIIVTDDGSSTATCERITAMLEALTAGHDIRTRFITHARTTPYRLNTIRNAGIAAASGEIILLVDGDILVPSGLLAMHAGVHDALRGQDAGAYVACVRRNLLPGGDIGDSRVSEWGRELDRQLLARPWQELWLEPEHALSQATFPRAAWERVGGFDPDFDGHWGFDEVEFAYRLQTTGTRLTSHGIVYHLDTGPGAGNRDAARNRALYERKKQAWQHRLARGEA